MPTTFFSPAPCGPGWNTWLPPRHRCGLWRSLVDRRAGRRHPALSHPPLRRQVLGARLLHLPAGFVHPGLFLQTLRFGPGRHPFLRLRSLDPHGQARLPLRLDSAIPGGIADAQRAKTLYERDDVFHASMRLLKRHYGYVPFSWVFGYTAYRMDRRDQFFSAATALVAEILASLPWPPVEPGQAFPIPGEWLCAAGRLFKRRA